MFFQRSGSFFVPSPFASLSSSGDHKETTFLPYLKRPSSAFFIHRKIAGTVAFLTTNQIFLYAEKLCIKHPAQDDFSTRNAFGKSVNYIPAPSRYPDDEERHPSCLI